MGTGWLGWSPDVVYNTPMPQIFMALEGKADFLRQTNPFGGGKKKPPEFTPEQKAKLAEQRSKFALAKADALAKYKVKNV